jgi:uncharacterized protein (TIRG00374 family)
MVIYYISTIKTDIKLLQKVNIFWLAAAITGQAATYLFSALVYQNLLKLFKEHNRLSIWQLFRASIVALFTDQIIPSAGISGSSFIFNFLVKRKLTAATAFSVIILELLTYYTAMEIIIMAGFVFSFFSFHVPAIIIIVLACGTIAYFLFALLVTFIGKKETILKLGKKKFKIKFLQRFTRKLTDRLEGESLPTEMNEPWSILNKHRKLITPVILFHICLFGADAFTILALFQGLGVSISFLVAFIAYLLARIISLLPISPGALILYESSMTFFLTRLGAPLGTSILVTLLFRFLSFWMPMPVGFFLFRKSTQ